MLKGHQHYILIEVSLTLLNWHIGLTLLLVVVLGITYHAPNFGVMAEVSFYTKTIQFINYS